MEPWEEREQSQVETLDRMIAKLKEMQAALRGWGVSFAEVQMTKADELQKKLDLATTSLVAIHNTVPEEIMWYLGPVSWNGKWKFIRAESESALKDLGYTFEEKEGGEGGEK